MSTYILTLVKPLPLTEMAEIPELPKKNCFWCNMPDTSLVILIQP